MKKLLLSLFCAATLFSALPASQATATEQDMAKIPCKDFLAANENQMGILLIWIDGYMSAKSDNTMMSDEWMAKLGTHMATFCAKNPTKTIMEAAEAMPEE